MLIDCVDVHRLILSNLCDCIYFIFLAEQFAEVMVKHGAIPALVKHLQAPPSGEGDQCEKHLEHQVEEGSAAILTILAKNVSWVSYC